MADCKIDKWLRWCDAPDGPVRSEVLSMYLHRYAFQTVRDMVNSDDDMPPSYFFEYVQDTCAVTQSMAVVARRPCAARRATRSPDG